MDNLKDILKHQEKISELQIQFDCYLEVNDLTYADITYQNIMDNALWTLDTFEELGHTNYEARVYYDDENSIKEYNQIKYFIKKWENK